MPAARRRCNAAATTIKRPIRLDLWSVTARNYHKTRSWPQIERIVDVIQRDRSTHGRNLDIDAEVFNRFIGPGPVALPPMNLDEDDFRLDLHHHIDGFQPLILAQFIAIIDE